MVRVHTDAGVVGTCFSGVAQTTIDATIKPALIGKDLFALDHHIRAGMNEWAAVEHAIWDAIGRLLNVPACKLLGGSRERVKGYFTAVWPGKVDQSHVTYEAQVRYAVKLKQAGLTAMKIRAWRPEPMDDCDAAGVIRDAVGDDFDLMYDRTAHHPGKVWDYDTALRVAKGMKKHRVTWLEEPFDRKDLTGPRRLARESGVVITGGEGGRGLEPFREFLVSDTYDILQPDGINAGGLFTIRKIGAMAEAFERPCILHGSTGLRLAGFLQISGALPDCHWQEFALMHPDLLPAEQWSPLLRLLKTKEMYRFEGGDVLIPQRPGLGLDIDEDAMREFRVR